MKGQMTIFLSIEEFGRTCQPVNIVADTAVRHERSRERETDSTKMIETVSLTEIVSTSSGEATKQHQVLSQVSQKIAVLSSHSRTHRRNMFSLEMLSTSSNLTMGRRLYSIEVDRLS